MLKVENVYKKLGSFEIEAIDFTLKKGESLGIFGRSGSGKTSIINLILGFLEADRGEIYNSFEKISVVFQEDRLIEDISGRENLKLLDEYEEDLVESYAKALALEGLDKKTGAYSGGMKRKLSIIRALVFGGDLLILDEAFRSLDKTSKDLAIDLIKSVWKDKSILMISHEEEDFKKLGIENIYKR